MRLTSLWTAPRATQRPSRPSQEASKGLLDASKDEGGPRDPILYRFGPPNGPLETSKTPKLAETSYEFCSFGKFHNFPFKTPPGLHLGTSWASFGRPFGVQEASEIVQESSKRPPSTPQEASKSAPFAPGSLPLADQPALGAPRSLQEASKASPGAF